MGVLTTVFLLVFYLCNIPLIPHTQKLRKLPHTILTCTLSNTQKSSIGIRVVTAVRLTHILRHENPTWLTMARIWLTCFFFHRCYLNHREPWDHGVNGTKGTQIGPDVPFRYPFQHWSTSRYDEEIGFVRCQRRKL